MYDNFIIKLNFIMKKERDIRKFVTNIDKNNLVEEIETFIKDKGRF
jgi:hypothetical protein